MIRLMWAIVAAAAVLLSGAERVTIERQRPERAQPSAPTSQTQTIRRPQRVIIQRQQPAGAAPLQHTGIVRSPAFIHGIHAQQRAELTPNRYYWHQRNGVRYSHYYDGRAHWYGFYHGPRFYWTRYHADRWWWFDASYGRWVYWWNGFWWWPGPAGASYVYIDSSYYPYERGGVMANQPSPSAAPASSPGVNFSSPDGKRMVQIAGSDNAAYLYDKSTADPTYLKFLAKSVDKVKFTSASVETPTRILLELKDGAFALYDADGNPLSAEPAAVSPGPPPDAPESIPPPPTSAPGN